MGNPLLTNTAFKTVFYSNPNPMTITTTQEGILLAVNKAFEAAFGYRATAVVGSSTLELKLWVDPAEREKAIELFNKNGRLREFEAPLRTQKGKIVIVLLYGETITINGDNYLLTTMVDISEVRLLRKEIERLRRLSSRG